MVAFFEQLYAVEYRGALLSVAEPLELRQRDAFPIWQRMGKWLELPIKATRPLIHRLRGC